MKKVLSFVLTLGVLLCCASPVYAEKPSIEISQKGVEDSSNIHYGIDLSGKDCCIDGLNANLVKNGSFEDKDNCWSFEGTDCILGDTDSLGGQNTTYNIVKTDSKCIIRNLGDTDDKSGAMGFVKGEKYNFTCFVKNIDFEGDVFIQLESERSDSNMVKLSTDALSKRGWTKLSTTISASATKPGGLAITFNGTGSLQIDSVSLVPHSSYGYGSEQWKNTALRADLVAALKNLNPSFIIFPVYAENWLSTIGETSGRSGNNEIGCHEYLQLCSDLNAEPIPKIIFDEKTDADTCAQNTLALIEYANADALTSYYGALRSGSGSENGFDLKYVYISGRNITKIKDAIDNKYAHLTVLNDEDITLFGANTAYGTGITKSNMGAALFDGVDLIVPYGFTAHKTAFSKVGSTIESSLIWFDEYSLVLSPAYYVQMIMANNMGEQEILLSQINRELGTPMVTIDTGRQVLYITFLNSGNSTSLDITLSDFDSINYVSEINVSAGYKSASNVIGKQRVAPATREIAFDKNSFTAELEANSITVIRVAYGSNTGDRLYQIPEEIDCSTKLYIPVAVKVVIGVFSISIPIGAVIGFFTYKNIISKSSKKKGDE